MPGLSLIGILSEGNMGDMGGREITLPTQHSKLTPNSLSDIPNF